MTIVIMEVQTCHGSPGAELLVEQSPLELNAFCTFSYKRGARVDLSDSLSHVWGRLLLTVYDQPLLLVNGGGVASRSTLGSAPVDSKLFGQLVEISYPLYWGWISSCLGHCWNIFGQVAQPPPLEKWARMPMKRWTSRSCDMTWLHAKFIHCYIVELY